MGLRNLWGREELMGLGNSCGAEVLVGLGGTYGAEVLMGSAVTYGAGRNLWGSGGVSASSHFCAVSRVLCVIHALHVVSRVL